LKRKEFEYKRKKKAKGTLLIQTYIFLYISIYNIHFLFS